MNLSDTTNSEVQVVLAPGVPRNLSLTIQPIASKNGATTISLTVTDANGLSSVTAFILTVTPEADAPTISTLNSDSMDEDESKTYTFTVSDADGGELTVTCSSSSVTLVSASGLDLKGSEASEVTVMTAQGVEKELTLVIRPENDQHGLTTISLTVTDAGGLSNVVSFDLTVNPTNDNPQISDLTNDSINEDQEKSYSFTVSDVDGDNLTVVCSSSALTLVSVSSLNLSGTHLDEANLTVQSNESRDLTLTITPINNQSGTTTISLTVTDADGLTDVTTWVLTVVSSNDSPTISTIQNISTPEETAITPTAFTVADVDGDMLTITVTSSDNTLVPSDSASITLANEITESAYTLTSSPGTITLTILPALNQVGSAQVTVTVSDGTAVTETSFTLTVSPENDPPLISNIEDQPTDEDNTISA
ncbi:MAG: hypothetical protein OMM_13243, partial [Candidatus Magnetoglobus multicellularis str. Araruama]